MIVVSDRSHTHTGSVTFWWVFLRGRVNLQRVINDTFCVDPFFKCACESQVGLQTCSLEEQSCLRIINVDTSRYQAYTCFKAVAWKHANVSSLWCTDVTRLKACHACISYSVSLYEQLTKCNLEPHDWWFDTLFSRNTPNVLKIMSYWPDYDCSWGLNWHVQKNYLT